METLVFWTFKIIFLDPMFGRTISPSNLRESSGKRERKFPNEWRAEDISGR